MLLEYKQMESKQRGLYTSLVGDVVKCRHVKNMSPIERRYVEAVLDDTIVARGIDFTLHSLRRMKERNISKGRIQMAVRQGRVQEVQFTKDGCIFLISFATGTQLGKGYLNYVGYDITTGKVVSVFNKQKHSEAKVDPVNSPRTDKEYMLDENCITLLHRYLNIEPEIEELVHMIRKYDSSDMDSRSEKKLQNFRQGKTSITQL